MEDQGKRIVLFVVIAAAIFIGWQMLFPPEKPSPKKPVATEQQPVNQSPTWAPPAGAGTGSAVTPAPGTGAGAGTTTGTDPAAGTGTGSAAPSVAPPAPVVEAPAVPESTIELTSKNLSITFSNIGGVVKRVHRGDDPMKGAMNDDLFVSNVPGVGLLSTTFVNSTYGVSPRAVWVGEAIPADAPTQVRYTHTTAEGLVLTKSFELIPEAWLVKMTFEAKLPANAKANQQLVVSMFGIAPEVEGQTPWRNKPGANCNMGGDVKTSSARSVLGRPRLIPGNVKYFGTATPFFMFGVSPKTPRPDYACNIYPVAIPGVKDGVQVDLVFPQAMGDGAIREELVAFLGPKYLDKLEGADEVAGYSTGLKDSIDFGWFAFISRPLLWLLRHIFFFVGNWGVAIILLTVLVKLATLYWTQKSMKSMKAMAALKPEMEAIQKKYPDDRQKQQQAQMELFKRHGVNPLSGCLPMLLQMPIWMGLYSMLSKVGELHQAVFIPGWLEDLTLRDPYYILPIALTGLMFLQSRIQPATGDSMQQKMIMYGMPLMFGVMGLWFPSGLTVYITTNTVLGILHSLWMKRGAGTPTLPVSKAMASAAAEKSAASSSSSASAEKAKPVIEVESREVDDEDEPEDDDDATDGDRPKATARPTASTAAAAAQQRRGKRRNKRR